jgi:hypothetical protein
MLFVMIILIWLLVCAWVTIWSLCEDLGFTTMRSWLCVIHSCVCAPILHFIVYPIQDFIRTRK